MHCIIVFINKFRMQGKDNIEVNLQHSKSNFKKSPNKQTFRMAYILDYSGYMTLVE
jgi:hypothetical protein